MTLSLSKLSALKAVREALKANIEADVAAYRSKHPDAKFMAVLDKLLEREQNRVNGKKGAAVTNAKRKKPILSVDLTSENPAQVNSEFTNSEENKEAIAGPAQEPQDTAKNNDSEGKNTPVSAHVSARTVKSNETAMSSDGNQQNKPDDDGWIKWEGGGCPVTTETKIDTKDSSGLEIRNYKAGCFNWQHRANSSRNIIAYRITKDETLNTPTVAKKSTAENLEDRIIRLKREGKSLHDVQALWPPASRMTVTKIYERVSS
jgi:hypothetical protein